MSDLNIIIPVKNEAENIQELVERIHTSLYPVGIKYRLIFVDDHSEDTTVEEIKKISEKYPVILHIKEGKPGKAYSILEGSKFATTDNLAMIDADLQYPPEVIPAMYKLLDVHGVVVSNRKRYKTSSLRKIGSKLNGLIFERILHGFKVDTQSGLKLFKKEIIEHLTEEDVTGWTVDMPLLRTSLELGYSIGCIDIEFVERKNGKSKVNFLKTALEIGSSSLKLKFKKRKIYPIRAKNSDSPIGAGVAHKGKRFITHTHLPHDISALNTLHLWQKIALFSSIAALSISFILATKLTAIILITFLSFVYFVDLVFSLRVLLKSLHNPPEIKISDEELQTLKDEDLPLYTILCPLYKEAKILPHFIGNIDRIDWPKEKLEVILLLEEDDKETISASQNIFIPSYIRTLIVPQSQPKTKPKACNYGLAYSQGEYLVIYDAEDEPDPLQLKKAYLAFKKLGDRVVCLQSKLNYYNTHHNVLTRLFTTEYSLWFDLILPGLQAAEAVIPLGGTSNHFKTEKLKELHGWDPFNVTEDCDLGARLFKNGYKTALLDSTTYEEANSRITSWIRQRSRWIKGYIQTYLVHMRDPIRFHKEFGLQALIFQLVVGARMTFILINPILWAATISYFTLYKFVGPAIESLYPTPVFYIAVTSLVFGNFIYFYNYMMACAKKGQWSLVKWVFLIPIYWLITSIAAAVAFYQLIVAPHFWEKTEHGLHLEVKEKRKEAKRLLPKLALSDAVFGGGVLIFASMAANFSNFLYNAYLGRSVDLSQFGTVSLIGNIFTLVGVITAAVSKTVSYKTAYLLGKFGYTVSDFWDRTQKVSWFGAFITTLIWLLSIPLLANFFNEVDIIPFLLFTPFWIFALVGSVNNGFLSGNLKFGALAVMVFLESTTKLLFAYLFIELGFKDLVYAAIPASLVISFVFAWIVSIRLKKQKLVYERNIELKFPVGFFTTSILTSIAGVATLTFDVILAKHYLPAVVAGQYALLSLSGKIVYFLGSLFAQFITPIVSKREGAGKKSENVFYKLLGGSIAFSFVGFLAIGIFGHITTPLLFGEKAVSLIPYLPLYALAMFQLSVASAIVVYHQIRKHYLFPIISFSIAVLEVIGIALNHNSISDITLVVTTLGSVQLFLVTFFHVLYEPLLALSRNVRDLLGLFTSLNGNGKQSENLRILVLNWRDTKHVYGGGAEVYIEEIAKRWVKEGHKITLFCGNDGKSERNEVVDGIRIIRRGGFYTVYVWAFFYYLFQFYSKFDIVVDCENGIPFFTPLYVRIPKILLIHHVHQDVFRRHLKFPLSIVAMTLESKLMPFLYKNSQIVTISESSKRDIVRQGWAIRENIQIVNPGINAKAFKKAKKTRTPTFTYVGRLKHYKNIDVAIKAQSLVSAKFKEACLFIAGKGEEEENLKVLARELGTNGAVVFKGFVSEKGKAKLLSKSWAAIQPSSFEGWGITVIEANACGVPVIASKTKGLSDSVVDGVTGILVPPKDPEELAKAMEGIILDKKARLILSRKAYEWSKNFSWDKSANQFLRIIFKTIEKERSVLFVRKFELAK